MKSKADVQSRRVRDLVWEIMVYGREIRRLMDNREAAWRELRQVRLEELAQAQGITRDDPSPRPSPPPARS